MMSSGILFEDKYLSLYQLHYQKGLSSWGYIKSVMSMNHREGNCICGIV